MGNMEPPASYNLRCKDLLSQILFQSVVKILLLFVLVFYAETASNIPPKIPWQGDQVGYIEVIPQ